MTPLLGLWTLQRGPPPVHPCLRMCLRGPRVLYPPSLTLTLIRHHFSLTTSPPQGHTRQGQGQPQMTCTLVSIRGCIHHGATSAATAADGHVTSDVIKPSLVDPQREFYLLFYLFLLLLRGFKIQKSFILTLCRQSYRALVCFYCHDSPGLLLCIMLTLWV